MNSDSMYEFYSQKAVCVCLKGQLFILSLLLFNSLKMYFYGIMITEL